MTAPQPSRPTEGEAAGRDCPSTGRHGDRTAYNHHGCRCATARLAAERYNLARRADLRAGRPRTVNGVGVQRRIQALMAIGWTARALGEHLGLSPVGVRWLLVRDIVHTTTAARVAETYRRLSDTPGPSANAAAQARNRGYQPPIAWDCDDLDDPAGRPWPVIDDWGNRHHRAWPCARDGCRGWAVAPGRIPRGEARPRYCSDRCTQTSEGR